MKDTEALGRDLKRVKEIRKAEFASNITELVIGEDIEIFLNNRNVYEWKVKPSGLLWTVFGSTPKKLKNSEGE